MNKVTDNTTSHYATLEVDKDATEAQLKKAYRGLSMIYHPDVKGTGDEVKFKAIKEAYEILSDPQERAAYDNALKNGTATKPAFTTETQDTYSDIFSSRGDKSSPQRGRNRSAFVELSFDESLHGTIKEVKFNIHVVCIHCKGKGSIIPDEAPICTTCGGTRKIVTETRNPFGHVAKSTRICPDCRDTRVEEISCEECAGKGSITNPMHVPVTIPAGVTDGTKIRVKGFGEEGINGGATGDLIITVSVESSNTFVRVGNDLYLNFEVSYTQLVLGDIITIPTIDGDTKVTIPPGTYPNSELRVKGMGVTNPENNRQGDVVIALILKIPTEVNAEQEQLLRDLFLKGM